MHVGQPTDKTTVVIQESKHVTVQSPYMTKRELADYLRCSTWTIDRRVKLGLIKEDIICGSRLYSREKNRIA